MEDTNKDQNFDIYNLPFDRMALEQTAALLRDELHIAVEEFLEDAAAYIKDIKEGITEEDMELIARGSHPLKSNTVGFGMAAVSKIAQDMNKYAREGRSAEIKQLMPLLLEAFKEGEKTLRQTIKNNGL